MGPGLNLPLANWYVRWFAYTISLHRKQIISGLNLVFELSYGETYMYRFKLEIGFRLKAHISEYMGTGFRTLCRTCMCLLQSYILCMDSCVNKYIYLHNKWVLHCRRLFLSSLGFKSNFKLISFHRFSYSS